MTLPDHTYQVFIGSKVEQAWQAITDGAMTQQYFYGTRVDSDWSPGAKVTYYYPDGTIAADGEVIAVDAPKRLEMSFHPRWDPELEAEGAVRQVWLVEDADGLCRLTVETYDMAPDTRRYAEFGGGLPYILSGMKTLLETGRPLAST